MIFEECNYKSVFSRIDINLVDCEFEPSELLQKARKENPELRNKLCDLIEPVSACLTEYNFEEDKDFYDSCENILVDISSIAPAHETLLSLIEIAEESDCLRFSVIVGCFEVCIPNFDTPLNPVCWCFNTIIRHLNEAILPTDCNLEEEQRALADCDPNFQLLKRVYEKVLSLCRVVCGLKVSDGDAKLYNRAVVQFLLKLLGRPMSHMDLEGESNKSAFRRFALQIINLLKTRINNPISFVEYLEPDKKYNSDEVVDCEYNSLSLGVFYYLVFVEKFMVTPKVYSPLWVFDGLLPASLQLISTSYSTVQRKGLLLVECLASTQGLKVGEHHARLVESLAGVMVYSTVRANRQTAVNGFRRYIQCLEPASKYTVLLNVVKRIENPGFVGFVSTLVKDIVAVDCPSYFSGKRLSDIVEQMCTLERGPETDLIEASDRIISSLNLVRFLVLRRTDVALPWVESHLTTLRRGLTLSRAHYELQVSESGRLPSTAPVTITVAGGTLPNMTQEQKTQILYNALNTLDLIDSLLNRVSECIAQSSKTNLISN